jgi:hypothetical protein
MGMQNAKYAGGRNLVGQRTPELRSLAPFIDVVSKDGRALADAPA